MTEDRIRELLEQADRTAGPPKMTVPNVTVLARRAHRRRQLVVAAPLAAAAVIAITAAMLWSPDTTANPEPTRDEILAMRTQIEQLQARTDAAVALIKEVLEEERALRRLAELQAQLAVIGEPQLQREMEANKAALALMHHGDRLSRQPNQTHAAIQAYERVISLFPKSSAAEIARKRLAEAEQPKLNRVDPKGASKWQLQDT